MRYTRSVLLSEAYFFIAAFFFSEALLKLTQRNLVAIPNALFLASDSIVALLTAVNDCGVRAGKAHLRVVPDDGDQQKK